MSIVLYRRPRHWLLYDPVAIAPVLASAKAAVLALGEIPYQRSWAEDLQVVQLKREVAGTSRIEGADFTEGELEAALSETPEQLHTRSQRQAAAAKRAYVWISGLPSDFPVSKTVVCEIHRQFVAGADDDHCPPGMLRGGDANVTFGTPRHRGVNGGAECTEVFDAYCLALERELPGSDPLISALAAHYHLAAMHPFLDGNGRTARGLEALFLQRCGLRNTLFIAMSNYYYEEKNNYLKTLAKCGANGHDLTDFLEFGLRGIEIQCKRLFGEIRRHISVALYRNMMYDLFNKLESSRKRVIAERQIKILSILLEKPVTLSELVKKTQPTYAGLKNPNKAIIRDLSGLLELKAIAAESNKSKNDLELRVRLEWPMEITETEFFERVNAMPTAKTHPFLDFR